MRCIAEMVRSLHDAIGMGIDMGEAGYLTFICADAVRISVSGGVHVSGLRNREIARRQVECWGRSAEASHPGPVAARSALGVCGSIVVLVQWKSGCRIVFVLQGMC